MNRSRVALPSFRLSAVALAVAAASVLAGASPLASAEPAQDAAERIANERARILEQYLIGPDAAAALGCEIAWQTAVPLQDGGALRLVESSPEAVLVLDNINEATHLRADTGGRVWTASAADPIDRVLGMGVYMHNPGAESDAKRIAVLTDAVYYALGFDSGATVARSRFRHVPNTPPVQYGGSFIFGSSSGQVTWFNSATGNDSRGALVDAFRDASPIEATPSVRNGIVFAGSMGGGIASLDADSGRLLWNRRLLGPVSASPAIANGTGFVASDDQYLYAFDVVTGDPLWRYFTQTPLKTSPFPAGDLVLQDVPGEGLIALSQRPEAQPGGEVRWRRASVHGRPIGMLGGDVVFWCPKGRMVTIISLSDGQTVKTVELPLVEHLTVDTIESGGFVAWSKDGRVERLSPKSAGK
ncbi:MAG: hypothetical protein RLZZ238_629 [Planctomycetota bacterium]